MIQFDCRIKKSHPDSGALRNPTPPKTLRLLETPTPQPCW